MIDIADLESRLKKAQIRAEKAKSAYESAANEAVRLETTLSVVREIIGVSDAPNVSGGSLSAKQKILVNSLKCGENNAMSPIDIYAIASSNPNFNGDINYVRTTLCLFSAIICKFLYTVITAVCLLGIWSLTNGIIYQKRL